MVGDVKAGNSGAKPRLEAPVYAAIAIRAFKVPGAVWAHLRFLLSAKTVARFRANGFAEP